jgi:hypothetical protein
MRPSLGILAAAALAVAGCGGGGGGSKPAPTFKGSPDPAAGHVAQAYINAYAKKQPHRICSLLAAPIVTRLGGAKCAATVNGTLKGITFPKLQVNKALSRGNTAQVSFKGTLRLITLTREGGRWKVINGG